MDDEQAVAAYLAGRDPELFREIVERHQAAIARLVAALLGPFADLDAQEVTQEVFLRAHERLASFRGEARFSSWLYRLAYNRTLEHRRRARLRLPTFPPTRWSCARPRRGRSRRRSSRSGAGTSPS